MADDGLGNDGGEVGETLGEESGRSNGADRGNIVDLAGARRKRKQAVKDKISPRDRESCYLSAMRDGFPGWATFPTRFQVMLDTRGVRTILREGPGQVLVPVDDIAVMDALVSYSREDPAGNGKDDLWLSSGTAREVFLVWRATQPPIAPEVIAPVRELSDPGYCWQRLPFDLAPGPTPRFDELFNRIDNAPAVKAWLGSSLEQGSDREQYVWIYGIGNTGKSSLVSFVEWIFGPSARSEQPPGKDRKHWTAGLIGAVMVLLADCDDPHFVTTGLFKSLTGGDSIRVEPKGGAVFTAKMVCRFLIMSNEKPRLSSAIADQRRAIYAEVDPIAPGTELIPKPAYIEMLKTEASAFLYECRETWKRIAPNGRRIPAETERLSELTASNEFDLEKFMNTFFCVPESVDPKAADAEKVFTSPDAVSLLFTAVDWAKDSRDKWYQWAKRRHGVERKRVWDWVESPEGEKKRVQEWRVLGMTLSEIGKRDYALLLKQTGIGLPM